MRASMRWCASKNLLCAIFEFDAESAVLLFATASELGSPGRRISGLRSSAFTGRTDDLGGAPSITTRVSSDGRRWRMRQDVLYGTGNGGELFNDVHLDASTPPSSSHGSEEVA